MLTVARNVGRLVEARFSGHPTEADVATWRREAAAVLQACVAHAGKPALCCTDIRASSLFSPRVGDELVAIMKADSAAVARNAILAVGGATFTLQAQRMLRETGSEQRRVFTDAETLFAWLDETLTPAERVQLRRFVAEGEKDVGSRRGGTIPPPDNGDGPRRAFRAIKGGRS